MRWARSATIAIALATITALTVTGAAQAQPLAATKKSAAQSAAAKRKAAAAAAKKKAAAKKTAPTTTVAVATAEELAAGDAAAGAAGSSAPPATAPATGVPVSGSFTPTITWRPCAAETDCGDLEVPLDYANPASETVVVAVARRKASDPANRIGILVVNPGGPAGSAVDLVESSRFAAGLPPEVRSRFDIVGIDPRGLSGSVAVSCQIDLPARGTPADEAARAFAAACNTTSGRVLPFVGTDSSANDIESLRIAMGESQISYLGFSYGTYLGTLYSQKYPDRIRAAVLDAAVDGSIFGVKFFEDQMRTYERTLNEFLTWCQGNTRCGLNQVTPNVRQRYDEMLLIASKSGIGREKISKETLEILSSRLLGQSWVGLGRALGELSRGGTAATLSYFESISGDRSATYSDGSYESILCRDGVSPSARPTDPGDRLALFTAAAPHFTDIATYWATEQQCSTWAVAARDRLVPQPAAVGKMMVIGNTLDVKTPIEWAQTLGKQLNAPIVTFESYLHTATTSGDPCVTAAVRGLLIDLRPPPDGTFCASAAR
jgi:pimeloyl-ACP methyl ester carboxylesterase